MLNLINGGQWDILLANVFMKVINSKSWSFTHYWRSASLARGDNSKAAIRLANTGSNRDKS